MLRPPARSSSPARRTVGKRLTQAGGAAEDTGQTGGRGAAPPGRAGPPPQPGLRCRPHGRGSAPSAQVPERRRFTLRALHSPGLPLPRGARDGTETRARVRGTSPCGGTPAGPLGPQGPRSCEEPALRGAGRPEATRPHGGQGLGRRPARRRPGTPGTAREGQPGQRAFGRGQPRRRRRGAERGGGRDAPPARGAGVASPPRGGAPLRRCGGSGPRPAWPRRPRPARPRSAGSCAAAPPAAGGRQPRGGGRGGGAAAAAAAGRSPSAPHRRRREAPPAPGGERGLGASRARRARGGRCFPRHGPAGGARPWPAPVRVPAEALGPPAPLRDAGTRRAGVRERTAACASPRSEGPSGLRRRGRRTAAEVARGDGRPGEVPRQRRERCHRKSRQLRRPPPRGDRESRGGSSERRGGGLPGAGGSPWLALAATNGGKGEEGGGCRSCDPRQRRVRCRPGGRGAGLRAPAALPGVGGQGAGGSAASAGLGRSGPPGAGAPRVPRGCRGTTADPGVSS